MLEKTFALALMNFSEQLADLAAAIAAHRDKLVNQYNFSSTMAEQCCTHLHMRMVELMCMPAAINK